MSGSYSNPPEMILRFVYESKSHLKTMGACTCLIENIERNNKYIERQLLRIITSSLLYSSQKDNLKIIRILKKFTAISIKLH